MFMVPIRETAPKCGKNVPGTEVRLVFVKAG